MTLGELHLIMGRKENKKIKNGSFPSLSAPQENASFVSGFNPVWMGKAC